MIDQKPVLLISASDSSAAAGMQVDLRILSDLGIHARCAITAVTVQGDAGARSINPVAPEIVLESIQTALTDSPGICAVKVGLIASPETASHLAAPLSRIKGMGIPIVVDPVMRSTPGSALSKGSTAEALLREVLPWTTLLTPNRSELAQLTRLSGAPGGDEASSARFLMEDGPRWVLVTGGDTEEDLCVDTLYGREGEVACFSHPRIEGRTPRGTGCALSTTIAAALSGGVPMERAVEESIKHVTGLIREARLVGEQLLLVP